MKPIIFRITIIPLAMLMVLVGLISFVIIWVPYWILTGKDFLMDKYFPFCDVIIYRLKTKLNSN